MVVVPVRDNPNEEQAGADMANRPSHGLQERIIAFVASKPNQEISRNGSHESCASWISKRLDTTEKAVTAELEALEREGKIRLSRGTVDRGIKSIQVARGVEPEEWAMKEVQAHQESAEAPEFQLPTNLDYRQLGESLLLAALGALTSGTDHQAQYRTLQDEVESQKEHLSQLRAEVSHAKAERDAAIRGKKVAEDAVRDQKNRGDEALARAAELESDVADLESQVAALQQQLRTVGTLEDLEPGERIAVSTALAKLIAEQK
jgi:chromosome segregation ATPase